MHVNHIRVNRSKGAEQLAAVPVQPSPQMKTQRLDADLQPPCPIQLMLLLLALPGLNINKPGDTKLTMQLRQRKCINMLTKQHVCCRWLQVCRTCTSDLYKPCSR